MGIPGFGARGVRHHPIQRIAAVVTMVWVVGLLGLPTAAAGEVKPANIVVNTSADTLASDGLCSLREAINASNSSLAAGGCIAGTNQEDLDHIGFAIGTGVPTINILSNLPELTKPVLINGSSGGPRVRLHGPNGGLGLNIGAAADGTVISNLEIDGFQSGIYSAADGIWIRASVIGPNLAFGITSNGLGATIGGSASSTNPCLGYCNRIIGHGDTGIHMGASGTIQGNVIGLDAAGTPAPNGRGIHVTAGSVTIGGTVAGAGNVVSGNVGDGLDLYNCTSCVVQGNLIGTNTAGTAARPNGDAGIYIHSTGGAVIGGGVAGAGNIISGNVGSGIYTSHSTDTVINGNLVGVGSTGGAIGNAGDGIWITGIEFQATHATIGTTAPGTGNTIRNNGGAGVRITGGGDEQARNNSVRGNSISGNAGAGILLENFANNNIAAPTVTGIRPIRGTGACFGCQVDVYSDSADEGRYFDGTAIGDAFGNWELPGLFAGAHVTATQTDSDGNTSAFSAPFVPTSPFTDIGGSSFTADITWLYANGITTGCSATLYCPLGTVTREQMASFLVRMFDLPPTGTDFFSDDETSTHEANINRLAAAGITTGCGAGLFCPKAPVLRDQMASFLARAAELTIGAGRDYFFDDDGNSHEANIDRNAAAGITTGCATYAYCPSETVTRQQMAAFLHRILAPVTPPPYPAPP